MFKSFKRSLISASAALIVTGVASAASATVYIGESTGSGTTQIAMGTDSAFSAGGTYGNFTITTVSGTATSPSDYLLSNALAVTNSGGGTLTLYVTATGLTQNAEQMFLSSFTSNALASGLSVTEQTFLDTGDGVFTTVTPLASEAFTAAGVGSQIANLGSITDPFSITEVYTLTSTGAGGNFQANIDVSAVPEPATWAMLILGFLGVGFTAYRRKASFRFS
jgi:PEP-CTERM motif